MRESRNLNKLKYAAKFSRVQAHGELPSRREMTRLRGGLEAAAAAFLLLHGRAEEARNINYLNLISVTV